MNTRFFHLVATSALAAACLSACGGGGGGTASSTSTPATGAPVTVTPNTPSQPSQPSQPGASFGTVALAMTAEPGCGYDAINVTVTKIRFHASASAAASDAGWTEIALQPARRINLAQLNNGIVTALGSAALLPGHYAQARLVLDQNSANTTINSVVAAGATAETPLLTQAAAPDGVAIDLGNGFDVVNGQSLKLVADFDGCRSVAPSGANVVLRPLISILPAIKNGIDGVVDPALLGSNVRVSAQQNGVVVRAALPVAGSGAFSLSYLPPGSYEVVITADGHAAAVIAGVKVADSSAVLALNSAAAPIALPASATGAITAVLVLQPASTIDAAYGSAYQTFANGPRASMRDRMAGIGGGFVRFDNLPLSRPSLAVWNGQPLQFTEQAAIVEGAATYTILSTAPGYVTTSATTAVAR
ncbi:DUF4382 domain-containing protein [Massilia sp. PWRC2]|uniref:DUF4382 domain-containing protein n=1 Tax=Massilia sp. PWRC2 TaxID=2804626 RepID=UPI003CEA74A1